MFDEMPEYVLPLILVLVVAIFLEVYAA